jgi:glutamyl-tRNA reductase
VSVSAIGAAGVSHREAPLSLLDRLAYRPVEVPAALTRLVAASGAREVAILATCNRVEVYARFLGAPDPAPLVRFLAKDRALAPGELRSRVALRVGAEAARHLLRVAAGLDSMLVLEHEIQGQVRAAAELARRAGVLGGDLGGLFDWAQLAGRRVRREVPVDAPRRSLGHAAVDAGAAVLGGLGGRTVLVVGTGKIATAVAERARMSGAVLLVCGRTQERAERLAGDPARALGLDGLVAGFAPADLVVACAAVQRPLLGAGELRQAVTGRTGAPLVVIDLAVPRSIDPGVRDLPGIRLFDLEGLGHVGAQDAARWSDALADGERIVEEETRRYLAWDAGRVARPTAAALQRQAAWLCERELDRAVGACPTLDRAAAGAALHRVAAKLLHGPLVMAHEAAAAGDHRLLADLGRMFDLDVGGREGEDPPGR